MRFDRAAATLRLELLQLRARNHLVVANLPPLARGLAYSGLLLVVMTFGARVTSEFIYFQF